MCVEINPTKSNLKFTQNFDAFKDEFQYLNYSLFQWNDKTSKITFQYFARGWTVGQKILAYLKWDKNKLIDTFPEKCQAPVLKRG